MTTEDQPRKRLMVPAIDDPRVVILGDPVDGFRYFGPVSLDDPGERLDARTRIIERNGDEWWLAPLPPLTDMIHMNDDPADPVEVKRDEFLRLAGEARAYLAEAESLAYAANLPGRSHLAEQASSVGGQGYELMERAFALAEELLA